MHHLAAAFEDDAFVDAQARRLDVAAEDRRMMDLDAVLRLDDPVHFAADDDGAGLDLAVDARAVGDDEGVRREDFPAERAADPDRALEAELPFELTAVVDDSGDYCVSGGKAEVSG